MRAVKRKVKLSQVFKNQAGYDEPPLHLHFLPSPPGFVYYVLKTCKKKVYDDLLVIQLVLNGLATQNELLDVEFPQLKGGSIVEQIHGFPFCCYFRCGLVNTTDAIDVFSAAGDIH